MQNPYGRHLLTILAGAVFTEPQVQVHLEVEQPQRGGGGLHEGLTSGLLVDLQQHHYFSYFDVK